MNNYFLYQLSKFILNEEESGKAITPDEFSRLLGVSSLELTRQVFKGYEEGQEITDILRRFKSSSTISFSGGIADLPVGYFRRSALVANESWVDFCSDYEFNIRKSGEVNFERYEKLVENFFDEIVQGKEVATEESETPRESDKLQGKAVRKSVSPQERDMINFLRKFKKSLTLSLTAGEANLPSDFYRAIYIAAGDAWVELLDDREFGLRAATEIPYEYRRLIARTFFLDYEDGSEARAAMERYKAHEPLTFTAGKAPLPTEFFIESDLVADGRPVEILMDKDYFKRKSSYLKVPSETYPIARIANGEIEISPSTITGADFYYLVRPDAPTEDNPIARTLGDEIHILPDTISSAELFYLRKPDTPTKDAPICRIIEDKIEILPATITSGGLDYLRKPESPFFDYYYDEFGRVVYLAEDATHTLAANEEGRQGEGTGATLTSESKELDWGDNEKLIIVGMVCSKAGANLKDGQIVEYAETFKQQQA